MSTSSSEPKRPSASNFIRDIIDADLRTGKTGGRVVTRFPPEPNGYLHIGHAKSICLNFGLALDYQGVCHLRFDDTNPVTEEVEFVESIQEDVRWLGFDWGDKMFFASDYFEELYQRAELLTRKGLAYVDSLNEEEIRQYRGTVTEPGRESPYRERTVEENLELFRGMRAGEFPDGAHVLRARIDMASPNMLMRDPVLYRIKKAHHHRTGDDWCIYPMYDYAHPLSDAIENITHSICTLEFEVHRPLYDWVVDNTWDEPLPHQYEFARLNLDYTVMSKRKLLQLVNDKFVGGWDDPRMPTLSGMRRRGFTPASIRMFADMIGVAKADNRIDIGLLEYCIRTDLNHIAPRVMAVLRPLKIVLTAYPEGETEQIEAEYFPHDIGKEGSRIVPFSRELYIEREDFDENPPPGFHRLSPGAEVRLRHSYIIRCDEVIKDPSTGDILELRCSHDPATRSGADAGHRKVKGTLHWVSAAHAVPCEVRLYDRLFSVANPDAGPDDFKTYLNPDSVEVLSDARIEPSVTSDPADVRYQFTRLGYFVRDAKDTSPDRLVFNQIVTLRDAWSKKSTADADEVARPAGRAAEPAPVQSASPTLDDRVSALSTKRRERFDRYVTTLGLNEHDALVLADNQEIDRFFEEALSGHDDARSVANWVVNELPAAAKGISFQDLPFDAAELGRLITLIEDGTISNRTAKDVLVEMVRTGEPASAIVERNGLRRLSDKEAVGRIVQMIVDGNPDKVDAFRGGKQGLIGFFVGQVMRETKGTADPVLVQELLAEALK